MKRAGICSLVLGAIAVCGAAWSSAPALDAATNEPYVVFSVTGGTLTGGVHRQVSVYNSGFVTVAKFDTPVFPTPGVFKDVQTTSVSSADAFQLLVDLVLAGAATVPEQRIPIPDVPVNTLTILEGKEIAFSRTISFSGGGPYFGIMQVMNTFLQKHFPGF